MAYRFDDDLEFLGKLQSKDLDDLVYCLIHDTDGKERLTEELTSNNLYKRYAPDHNKYWEDIAGEIQCFGANTFATLFRRGKGVKYNEVLADVCDKLKVNYNKNSSTEMIENNLLLKILQDALEKMTPEDIKSLGKELGINNTTSLDKQATLAACQTIFKMGGFKSYQLTLIIANAIMKALFGRGLTLVANSTLTRIMAILTGPIGWAITALWTMIDIAGPAYRVTIPAVIQVAYLRKKYTVGY